jgi:hypothetical protein
MVASLRLLCATVFSNASARKARLLSMAQLMASANETPSDSALLRDSSIAMRCRPASVSSLRVSARGVVHPASVTATATADQAHTRFRGDFSVDWVFFIMSMQSSSTSPHQIVFVVKNQRP